MTDEQEYNTNDVADKTEMPDTTSTEADQGTTFASSMEKTAPNMVLATIGAILGATLGACIWFATAYYTGYMVGFVAIASGILAGLGASKFGKGKCATVGIIAALAGGAGVLGGSWMTYYASKHSEATRQRLKEYFDDSCGQLAKVAKDVDKAEDKRDEARQLLAKLKTDGFDAYYKKTLQDSENNYVGFIAFNTRDTGIMIMMGLIGMYCGYRAGSGEQT